MVKEIRTNINDAYLICTNYLGLVLDVEVGEENSYTLLTMDKKSR